jgi:hypothetical protein
MDAFIYEFWRGERAAEEWKWGTNYGPILRMYANLMGISVHTHFLTRMQRWDEKSKLSSGVCALALLKDEIFSRLIYVVMEN